MVKIVRKTLILLIFLSITVKGYPFWIWSPKTKKWKNPEYSALVTPYLQYRQALKFFEERKYPHAYKSFKKLLIHYPDSQEAAEAQFYLGRCLEEMDNPYQAFIAYRKVIDTYPNSKRISEIVKRMYAIGDYFLGLEAKKWLGMSKYDFVEHPSIEIFTTIVTKIPTSPYAVKAQYKLGVLFLKLRRDEEARDAFQAVIDNYPGSEWVIPAKYQLAIATARFSPGADYDVTSLKEAARRLDEFLAEHPEGQISASAEEQLSSLRNTEAKKAFEIAQFYEKQRKYVSARLYYKMVIDKYSDSDYVQKAKERIQALKEKDE